MASGGRWPAGTQASESICRQCYDTTIVRIYLDNNATTRPYPAVVEAVTRVLRDSFGNASSVHAFGQQAKAELDDARTRVASLIDAEPSEIVFTSGGTEADNAALHGGLAGLAPTGRRRLITTGIEHEAILVTARALERAGHPVTILSVDSTGIVDPAALERAITDDTAVVSVMHANNEVGTIQPIAALAAIAKSRGALFHTDAVQSVGKIPVSVRALGVDLLSLSGHKFGGPKGVGALWVRRGVRLTTFLTGGKQERSRRAGTENVAGLAGLGVAAAIARGSLASAPAIAALRDDLERRVLAAVPGTIVNGETSRRVPNTSNISFEGIEAESLLIALDLEGVAVSTGSACSSGSLEPSHVLRAMGLSNARTRNSLRFSFSADNTTDEVAFVADRLPGLVEKLRRLTATAVALR